MSQRALASARSARTRTVQVACSDGAVRAPKRHRQVSRMNKLKQNFNAAGVSLFLQIVGGNNSLAIPHLSIQDISQVNWHALKAAGLKGCVFDKDNTLCKPFALTVDPVLLPSLEECMAAFEGRVVLFSNSAGLQQYDPDGMEAEALEKAFGVKVLRHVEKKPAGGCSELEQLFGCSSSEMVMVGDRYLTDVVYGNRHGMLTIRPAPLTLEGEPPAVLLARKVEEFYVGRWTGQGIQAPPHALAARWKAGEVVRPHATTGGNNSADAPGVAAGAHAAADGSTTERSASS